MPYRDFVRKENVIINDKLEQFLSTIYLGPLFEDGEPKEAIQTYLNFLNLDDPYYRVTIKFVLTRLIMDIYHNANDIKCIRINKEEGTRAATEVKDFFAEEYDRMVIVYTKHQEKYGEVVGDYRQYKLRTGKPTLAHGQHLLPGEPQPLYHRVWRIPQEHSNVLVGAFILCNNTKKYRINDLELDTWTEYCSLLYCSLEYSKKEMVKHPKVHYTPVKSAVKT